MKHPQPPQVQGNQFFKVVPDKVQYWGNRWFRYNIEEDRVVTVCLIPGEADASKGKHTCIGVYTMGRLSFLSNYFAFGKVESISRNEYEEAFDKVVKILR